MHPKQQSLEFLQGQSWKILDHTTQLFEAYAFNRNQMWHLVIRVTTPEWQTPGVAAGNACEVLSFLWHEKDIRWATIGKSAVTAILHSRLILTLVPSCQNMAARALFCPLKCSSNYVCTWKMDGAPHSLLVTKRQAYNKKHQPCYTMVRRGWPLFDRKASGFTVVSLLVDLPRVEKANSVRGSCRKHVGSREC